MICFNGHNIRVVLEKDAEFLAGFIDELDGFGFSYEDLRQDGVLYIGTKRHGCIIPGSGMKRYVIGSGSIVSGIDESSKIMTGRYFINTRKVPSFGKKALQSIIFSGLNAFSYICSIVTNVLIFHGASIEKKR